MKPGIGVTGRLTLTKIDRATGIRTVVKERRNQFLPAGIERIAKRFALTGDAWTQANIRLRANTTAASTNAGPHDFAPGVEHGGSASVWSTSGGSMVVRFADTGNNRYSINAGTGMEVRVGGVAVSRFTAGVAGWGEKAAGQTWVWTYTVSFTGQNLHGASWPANISQIVIDRLTNSGVGTTAGYNMRATTTDDNPAEAQFTKQSTGAAAATVAVNPSHASRWDFELRRTFSAEAGAREYEHTRFYLGNDNAQPFVTIDEQYSTQANQPVDVTLTITFVDHGENL